MELIRTILTIILVSVVLVLVLTNWKGANTLLSTSAGASNSLIRTLQ